MKKIFWTVLIFLLIDNFGFCGTSNIQVKLTASNSEIFIDRSIVAIVEVINTGMNDLQLPRPDVADFSSLLKPDNPNLLYSGSVGITSINSQAPTISVKPGESVSIKVYLSNKTHNLSSITFRMGFKSPVDSLFYWSNPVTVRIKSNVKHPVMIEASLQQSKDISDAHNPKGIVAHIRITNTSDIPQDIGNTGSCGSLGLDNVNSNNPDIFIPSEKAGSYPDCTVEPKEIVLKPGEIFEENRQFEYKGKESAPISISFRIGIKTNGYFLPVWSNPVGVDIIDGNIDTESLSKK